MDDSDLLNLVRDIPTEFPCYRQKSGYDIDSEGNRFYRYVTEKRFLQAVEKCLHDFSLFTDEEFLAYLKQSSAVELDLEQDIERILNSTAEEYLAYARTKGHYPDVELVNDLIERMNEFSFWVVGLSYPYKLYYIDQETNELILYDEDYVCINLSIKFNEWLGIIIDSKILLRLPTPDTTEDETQTDSEPNNATASTARKGRPVEPFEAILYGDDEQKLRTRKRLHEVMKGKSGKKAMVFIVAAVELGLIANPTYTQLKNEFGEGIGSQPNCDNFKNSPRQLRRDEIEGAKKLLER